MYTIFLPLLVQIGLTLTVLAFVPLNRIRDMKADPTLLTKAATDSSLYSEASKKVANNYNNQFQLPALFYVGCLLAIILGATGLWQGIFAWAFVGARIVHAFIHCGANIVRLRFYAFALGLASLIGFWATIVWAAHNHPMLAGTA